MKKNIVLVGFMGSGKSMIGRALAKRLKIAYVSTDEAVEAREGMAIDDIFQAKGEAYFRGLEHEVVKEVAARRDIVIDCGGGMVLNPKNLKLLKRHGIVFHLNATPEVIYQRVKHESHRPLLKVPDPLGRIKELYNQRLPLYNQADYTIDANDASIEGPVARILAKVSA